MNYKDENQARWKCGIDQMIQKMKEEGLKIPTILDEYFIKE